MTDHSRLAVVGAFGATYISFAVADIDELTVFNFALLNSADFERPMDALARYLKSVPTWPTKVCFAFTGDIIDDVAHVESLGWTISKNDIRVATHANDVLMIRDLEALALMLPHLAPYALVAVQSGKPSRQGTRLVINSGAMLGVSALVHGREEWVPVVGYAGEASRDGALIGSTQMPFALEARPVASAILLLLVLGLIGAILAVVRISRVDPLAALGGNR